MPKYRLEFFNVNHLIYAITKFPFNIMRLNCVIFHIRICEWMWFENRLNSKETSKMCIWCNKMCGLHISSWKDALHHILNELSLCTCFSLEYNSIWCCFVQLFQITQNVQFKMIKYVWCHIINLSYIKCQSFWAST